MSTSYVSRLIKEGKYGDAKYEASMLPILDNLYFQSRIAELTGDFELALKLGKEGSDNAKSSEDMLRFTIAQAYAMWRLFEFDEAIDLLNTVSHIVEEFEFDPIPSRGTYFNILGLIYWKMDDLEPAFTHFEEALVIRQDLGDPSPISYTLNNLGNTYLKYRDYPKAKEYYEEAFKIRTSLGHQPAIAASHNSFGRYHDTIGEHTRASLDHKKSLDIWQKIGNNQFIAKSHRFMAINAYYLGKIEDNQIHWMKSDQLFTKLSNKTDLNTNIKLKESFYLYSD